MLDTDVDRVAQAAWLPLGVPTLTGLEPGRGRSADYRRHFLLDALLQFRCKLQPG